MDASLFDFEIPEELIAQYPIEPRDEARLLVLRRRDGSMEHRVFKELPSLLNPGDVIVLNDSKVIPARLILKKKTGGSVELLLLERLGGNLWRAMAKRASRIKPPAVLLSRDGVEVAEVLEKLEGGEVVVRLEDEIIRKMGEVPLPPYIRRRPERIDERFYQTVFARVEGSSASPTASLHFTEGLLEALKAKGIHVAFITLHVGPDTFRPIRESRVEDHRMHSEFFEVRPEVASLINNVRASGGRVVASGTTVVRALESAVDEDGFLRPARGRTTLYIYPPYRFKVVDALITNFHFPRSTLVVLVSAFAGRELILRAYREAVKMRYRFFSYGDAMLIL